MLLEMNTILKYVLQLSIKAIFFVLLKMKSVGLNGEMSGVSQDGFQIFASFHLREHPLDSDMTKDFSFLSFDTASIRL